MHENGKSSFSAESSLSHNTEKVMVTTSKFQIFWDLENSLSYPDFPSNFLVSQYRKTSSGPSNVSESSKCEVSKKIVSKNGISRFSVENFLAQSAEGFRCGTLRYIRKVRLSKNFMPKRLISLFSVNFFSRKMPIKFIGEPSVFKTLWDVENFYNQ